MMGSIFFPPLCVTFLKIAFAGAAQRIERTDGKPQLDREKLLDIAELVERGGHIENSVQADGEGKIAAANTKTESEMCSSIALTRSRQASRQ